MSFEQIDAGPFDASRKDDAKINDGFAVPCRLCQDAFHRVRLTQTYCFHCKKGICDEHGRWTGRNNPMCVVCGSRGAP